MATASPTRMPPPTSWRWSPESQRYYEQLATDDLDALASFLRTIGTAEQCRAEMMRVQPFSAEWDLLAKFPWLTDDTRGRARVLRNQTRAVQQWHREKELGLLSSPGDLARNYQKNWWRRANTVWGRSGMNLDFFTPRMAYQTWLGLTIQADMFWDDFGNYADDEDRIPPCAKSLVDGQSAFFWQLLDCFESLTQKIAKGEGPFLSCVGECIALHITVQSIMGFGDGTGGSISDQLEDDDTFQSLPVMTDDTNFRAWYGWNGPLGHCLDSVARPLALYTPSGFDQWAPVSEDVLERCERFNPFSASNRAARADKDSFDHVRSEAWHEACREEEEALIRFRQRVKSPAQVVAERADYTDPVQWFRPFPSTGDALGDNDDEIRDRSVATQTGIPLNRDDGASLHIGMRPFEEEDTCFLVFVCAYIKLPGIVEPVGEICAWQLLLLFALATHVDVLHPPTIQTKRIKAKEIITLRRITTPSIPLTI
eukprot:SAG31_NODE_167_length_21485_cov_31.094922_2_plen_483_part_00